MSPNAATIQRSQVLVALDQSRFPNLESAYLKVVERLHGHGFKSSPHPLPGMNGRLETVERGRIQIGFVPFSEIGESGKIRIDIKVAVVGEPTALFSVCCCGQIKFMSAREEIFFEPGQEDGVLEDILSLSRNADYLAEDYQAVTWS